MAKKVLVNEEDEVANTNGLLVLFFIVIAIFVGSLCFIGGIVYTSYIDSKNDEKCLEDKNIEEIMEDNSINDYVVTDENVIEKLKDKVDSLDIMSSESKETYIYNYLENTKNYYVLVAYGCYDMKESNKVVYTSCDKKDIYKEYNKEEKFELNDNNYNDFSKYKITFIKDGNNSYFKSIERIE